jgi:conjugal transfer pilus assembly protein TraW
MTPVRILLLVMYFLCAFKVYAEDQGTYGRTYQIKERDAITVMKEAAEKKLANGGKERMLKGAQDRYMASLENVATPQGIEPTKVNATRLIDISEITKESIKDTKGNIIIAAGTKINPLEIKPLSKKLFFIDAKDDRQIALVKQRALPNDKIILLGGSVFKAGEKLKRKVFLDIPGLHKRMDIRSLPSIVSQDGIKLKIEEIKL